MKEKSKPAAPKRPRLSGKKPLPEKRPDSGVKIRPARSAGFPVVGIGASAGGLAAFEAFFSGMPHNIDPGMAFVLVQHLAPDHKSLLSELVQRYTRMQVFEVKDGMPVRSNCAYIIPPNRDMELTKGKLRLLEQLLPHGQRLPIDHFFCSLAKDRREKAICIVLSGTGSDGTKGVRAVKEAGGMAMAQTPETASYDGMPRSAIATGSIDHVLPPAEMPAQLVAYVGRTFGKMPLPAPAVTLTDKDARAKIFGLLRAVTGHDFSLYKEKSVNRRIERRMSLHRIERLDGYLRYLEQNPGEAKALFEEILIGVTAFFRDPAVFEKVAEKVIPDLLRNRETGAALRIWVPGCSTGEEAYSIAILLLEQMNALRQNFRIQVFATDIDRRAIATARAGVYPSDIASNVSAQRLAQFFDRAEGDLYRIKKRIRDLLIFSEQNVIQDPPFSRLDMLCCRNLLIYLGSELQKKIIHLFHYALNPNGTLILGTSETVGSYPGLFTVIDRKAKIYRRSGEVSGTQRNDMMMPVTSFADDKLFRHGSLRAAAGNSEWLRIVAEKALLLHLAPVGILVNERGDIQYLHGRTGSYLEPSPGEAGMNIIRMAREGLKQELSAALRRATMTKAPVFCHDVRVKTNGDFTTVNVTVQPAPTGAKTTPASSPLMLVIIEETAPDNQKTLSAEDTGSSTGEGNGDQSGKSSRITTLKQELLIKEEYLQSTIEELNSSTEEMQSINEELQSSNEELETSKEELQSVNEELVTVNMELQAKVTDLTRVNNDMNNLLAGTGIGTIFVDNNMCIRRFTPAVTKIINLIASDVGRPVHHIVSNLAGYDHLMDDIRTVLDDLRPREDEVMTKEGAWYLLRIQPYRTLENVIEGVVITFMDISKRHEKASGTT